MRPLSRYPYIAVFLDRKRIVTRTTSTKGKYIGKKKGPAEVNGLIGHHKGVDPVVEHKSPQGQQKKGEKQRSSYHVFYPSKKLTICPR